MNRLPQYEATIIREPEGTNAASPFHGSAGKRVFFYAGAESGTLNLMVQGHREFIPMTTDKVDEMIADGTFSHTRPYKLIAETGYVKTPLFNEQHHLNGAVIQLSSGDETIRIGDQLRVEYQPTRDHYLPPGMWKIQSFSLDKLGLIHLNLVTHVWGPAIEREMELGDFVRHVDSKEFNLSPES